MYDTLHYFISTGTATAVVLPFDLRKIIAEWSKLRQIMTKKKPDEFTRNEWAYMISFLEKENLFLPFKQTFGKQRHSYKGTIEYLVRPRGLISLWLPNNVSLLGPLMLVLLSLNGNFIRIKGGSQSENLIGIFVDFIVKNLPEGVLTTYIKEKVTLKFFDRNDVYHKDMAKDAAVRIVFGSNETAQAIEMFPHPIDSIGIYFTDKQSEVWVEKQALSKEILEALVKVFAIYGQTGCTSPKKVVVIDGSKDDAIDLRDRLLEIWPRIISRLPSPDIASSNLMAMQLAKSLGWDAAVAKNNAAMLAVGEIGFPAFSSPMSLPIVWADINNAFNALPSNIQTLGYAFKNIQGENWIRAVAASRIKRFVPIASMHHFSHVWDGYDYWQHLFEKVSTCLTL